MRRLCDHDLLCWFSSPLRDHCNRPAAGIDCARCRGWGESDHSREIRDDRGGAREHPRTGGLRNARRRDPACRRREGATGCTAGVPPMTRRRGRMLWIALWAGVFAIGALGVLVNVQARRFERRVEREARALFAEPAAPPAEPVPLERLPAPVRRYLEVSGLGGGGRRERPGDAPGRRSRRSRRRSTSAPTDCPRGSPRSGSGTWAGGPSSPRIPASTSTSDSVDEVLVPFRLSAIRHLEEAPLPYARWQVEAIELGRPEPW